MIRRTRGRSLDMEAAGLAVVGLVAAEILGGGWSRLGEEEQFFFPLVLQPFSEETLRETTPSKRGAEIVGEAWSTVPAVEIGGQEEGEGRGAATVSGGVDQGHERTV